MKLTLTHTHITLLGAHTVEPMRAIANVSVVVSLWTNAKQACVTAAMMTCADKSKK